MGRGADSRREWQHADLAAHRGFFTSVAPTGYYVHLLQIVDFDGKHQYSLPLLNQAKECINVNEFGKFWEFATKLASQDKTIAGFRQLLGQAIAETSRLERKFDSNIKRLR